MFWNNIWFGYVKGVEVDRIPRKLEESATRGKRPGGRLRKVDRWRGLQETWRREDGLVARGGCRVMEGQNNVVKLT